MNEQLFDEGLVFVVGGLPTLPPTSEAAQAVARIQRLAESKGGSLSRYVLVSAVTSDPLGIQEYWVVKPHLLRLEEGLWHDGTFPAAIKGLVGGRAEPDEVGDRRRATRELLEDIESTLVAING